MKKYKLGEIAPIIQGCCDLNNNTVWLLNLDKVESNTGRIIEYDYVEKEEIGNSTIAFDNRNVLYSKLRPYLNKVVLPDRSGMATSEMIPLMPDISIISREYLTYFLRSKYFVEYINAKTVGAKMPRANPNDIKEVIVSCPELDKQKIITDTLDGVKTLLDKRQHQLSELDTLIKARFVEMFGDANINNMGWKKEIFSKNVTLINGRAYKQEELLNLGKYPVLRVGNFFSNRDWYYSNLELEEDKYCDDGDLLYAWSASFGPRIWNGGRAIYHYHIWKIVIGKAYNKQFLCALLENLTSLFKDDTHGIAMLHLTKSGMEQNEFIVPPIELQEKFSAFVAQVDKSKVA